MNSTPRLVMGCVNGHATFTPAPHYGMCEADARKCCARLRKFPNYQLITLLPRSNMLKNIFNIMRKQTLLKYQVVSTKDMRLLLSASHEGGGAGGGRGGRGREGVRTDEGMRGQGGQAEGGGWG